MATPDAKLRRQAIIRRLVYLGLAILVIVPTLVPLGLPSEPDKMARRLFDKIDALPEGSPVLLAFDYDPASKAELYPMSESLLDHCFRKGLHPLVMTNWVSGLGLCKELVEDSAKKHGKTSGTDYVFLGFRPGMSDLILNMGENLKGAFAKDYYGKSTENMPALEGVKTLKDVPVVVDVAAGATPEVWIAYGRDRFKFDLGVGCTAVIAPDLYPFLDSGQLVGFLGGLRGAADYENLLKTPGGATKGMDAQSLAHIYIIVLILGANVHFLWRRITGQPEG